MKEYMTAQRKMLIDFFEHHCDQQFTIDGIAELLKDGCSISKSAIYRNVDRMTEDGLLRRSSSDDGRCNTYQYVGAGHCCGHIHLQCTKCGRISHIEDENAENALKKALGQSNFKIDEQKTVLYGVCSKCN